MRIASLTVSNFRAIENQRFEFEDRLGRPQPVTVIAGPNGAGKTSLLFAITNALRGVLGYRTDDVPVPLQDDVRLGRDYGGWREAAPQAQVNVELAIGSDEQDAIREVLRIVGWDPPPALSNDRLMVIWRFPPGFDKDGKPRRWYFADVDPPIPHIRSWLDGRRLAIRAWNERRPGMSIDLLLRVGGLRLFPQDRNLQGRVLGGNGATRPVADEDPLESTEAEVGPEQIRATSQQEQSVTNILKYFSSYVRDRDEQVPANRNWEQRVQELFSLVCAPKEYVGYRYREDSPQGSPVLRDDDTTYPISTAASGELVILEYATRMTYPNPLNRSIILIDEPEIHLHPTWVRKLYLALPRWGDDNQFILTTHSLELRQRAQADNCLIDLGSLDS